MDVDEADAAYVSDSSSPLLSCQLPSSSSSLASSSSSSFRLGPLQLLTCRLNATSRENGLWHRLHVRSEADEGEDGALSPDMLSSIALEELTSAAAEVDEKRAP